VAADPLAGDSALDDAGYMIRVGFGATVLARGMAGGELDGIGIYAQEMLQRLKLSDGVQVQPFVFGASAPSASSLGALHLPAFGPGSVLSAVTGLPYPASEKLANRIDILHATDHMIPNVRRVPVVATVMDAIPLANPQWGSRRLRALKNALWRHTTKYASQVITISEYAKQEISRYFGVPLSRITVVPLGVDERWFCSPSADEVTQVRLKYNLPKRYFLFVGTLQPRKNLLRVIEAHQALSLAMQAELPLVVVGREGWGCDDTLRLLKDHRYGSLRWLQYVTSTDLRLLFSGGVALVFPSLSEGFGLPVLEAFSAGLPVITSNTTALPEVAGDAACYVDPVDVAAIRDAMRCLAEDSSLALSLRRKGLARAKLFPWGNTVQATINVYRTVLGY